MKYEQIALKKIILDDERFRISYYFSLENLILSLRKAGLASPPLVVVRDNHFILLSGWKRVLACLELSLSSLPACVVREEDDLKAFLLAFYENWATKKFSLLEKAEILRRLKRFGESEEKIVRYYMTLLDIPPTLSHLDLFLSISQFTPDVKRAIYEMNLSFSSVKLLSEFSPEERLLLLPLISPLGQNKQKEILEDIQELSRRDEIPLKRILAFEGVKNVLDSEKLSPLQKANKIRLLLKKKRYPVLSTWEESFNSLLRELGWPRGIKVNPVPFFEEEKFFVSFDFANISQFKNHLLKLQELSSKKEFSRMFSFK